MYCYLVAQQVQGSASGLVVGDPSLLQQTPLSHGRPWVLNRYQVLTTRFPPRQVYRTESDAKAAAKESAAGARLQRMADMTGGGSMVTLSSLATMDEDMETIQRLNLIIKVGCRAGSRDALCCCDA